MPLLTARARPARPQRTAERLLILCLLGIGAAPLHADEQPTKRYQAIQAVHQADCLARGWHKRTVPAGDEARLVFWKAPPGPWTLGAIIVLHGGGGSATDYCSAAPVGDRLIDYGIALGRPMVEFADMAVERGFAVFSLDSGLGTLTDAKGHSCGKRWNCVSQAHDRNDNSDLAEVRNALTSLIPSLRPRGSATQIFIAGVSNGGFMTVLASTHFPQLVTAFAPVSAGDPYGTSMDCRGIGLLQRKSAPGAFLDNETRRNIGWTGSCTASNYPHEQPWPGGAAGAKPAFKLFYHEGDAGVDISCKEKLRRLLTDHGFPDTGSFVIKNRGPKSIPKHFWQSAYNAPILEFFTSANRTD